MILIAVKISKYGNIIVFIMDIIKHMVGIILNLVKNTLIKENIVDNQMIIAEDIKENNIQLEHTILIRMKHH